MARTPAAKAAPAAADAFDADHVKVRCIVHSAPWTHEGPLAHGEETSVPLAVAEVLLANKHVELCE